MDSIEKLIADLAQFRDDRDWAQFHNTKDLALALSIEASELNELFLWKVEEDVNLDKVKEELADVLNYALLIAHKHDWNILQIVRDKLAANALKYPVEKAKGNASKYTEL